MNTKINLTYKDEKYCLEFNRETVKLLEKNGFKFALKNYDMFSNNFLNMRKTIGVFDAQNIKQLNKGLGYNPNNKSTKNRHQIIDIPDEDENEVIYPKYFLPSPGFGLLVQ